MTSMQNDEPAVSAADSNPTLSRLDINTLADALAFTREFGWLGLHAQSDLALAVSLLEKVIGLNATLLPAEPGKLIPILECANPERHEITARNWSRVLSMVRGLLRACGCHAQEVEGIPPHPAWVVLMMTMVDVNQRLSIFEFAHWCATAGIRPDEVTEQTLEIYSHFCRAHIIGFDPVGVHPVLSIIRNATAQAAKVVGSLKNENDPVWAELGARVNEQKFRIRSRIFQFPDNERSGPDAISEIPEI